MTIETQKVDVLADLQRLLDLSESTMDANTSTDATFIPMPIEEFIATVRSTSAAVAELIEAASNFLVADDIAEGYGSGIGGPDHDRLEAALAHIGGAA